MEKLLLIIVVVLVVIVVGVAVLGFLGVSLFTAIDVETVQESPESTEVGKQVETNASPTTSTEPVRGSPAP